MDNRFKVIIFGILALIGSVVVAMEIGAGNYILPALILIAVIVLGTISFLFPKAPLDGSILICAVCAIMITGKGFVYLGVGNILFTTELILGMLVVTYAVRVVFRQWPILPMTTPMALPLFLFFVYLFVHLYFDVKSMGIMALRDAGTVYYAGFFLASYQLAFNPQYVQAFYRIVAIAIAPTIVVVIVMRFVGSDTFLSLVPFSLGGRPLMAPHVDAIDHVLLGTVFMLFQVSKRNTRYTFIVAIALLATFTLMFLTGRGALLVVICSAFAFLLFSRQWGFFKLAVPFLIIGGVLFAFAYSQSTYLQEQSNIQRNLTRIRALHEVTMYDERDRSGQTTAEWRIYWWNHITDRVMRANPIYGLGLGADLQMDFMREYYRNPGLIGDQSATRGAHNAFFTIFGRLGFIGAALFTWIVIVQLIYFRRAALLWRHYGAKLHPMFMYCWGALITGFVITFLQYTWEGPYSALPFWTISGIAYCQADKLWREYKQELAENRRKYLESKGRAHQEREEVVGS